MSSTRRAVCLSAVILGSLLAFPQRQARAQRGDERKEEARSAASRATSAPAAKPAAKDGSRAAETRPAQAPPVAAFGRLPLSFEVNQGQTAAEVNFLARGAGYTLFLTPTREVVALKRAVPPRKKTSFVDPKPTRQFSQAALEFNLLGSNGQAKAAGAERLPGISNYFIGNDPTKWRTNIPNYDTATGSPHSITLPGGNSSTATLSVNLSGTNGTVKDALNSGTISCSITNGTISGTCMFNYTVGTAVSLQVFLGAGTASFTWTAGPCTGTSTNPCNFTVNTTTTVSATFAAAGAGPSFTSTTLPSGAVSVPYGADLQVTGGTPPYSFAVTTGSLPAGFTLDATASGTVAAGHIFSDSPGTANTSSFGITVTDSTNLTATATISLTITGPPPNTQASLLKGLYAFVDSAFSESDGSFEVVGGSLNFDGINGFTGVLDSNNTNGKITLNATVSGTYSIGPDNRGFILFTTCPNPPCKGGLAIAVGNVYRGVASTFRVTNFFDDNGNDRIGTGDGRQQDPTSFTKNAFAGTYTFGFTGVTSSLLRAAGAGLATVDNAGNIVSVTLDTNDGGTSTGPTTTAPDGTYTGPDANGRIVATPSLGPQTAVYQISTNEFFAVSLSAGQDIVAESGLRQANPGTFSTSSIKGPDVLVLDGATNGGNFDTIIGLATASGTPTTLSITFDENDGGTTTLNQSATSTALTVTAAGRGNTTIGMGPTTVILYFAGQDNGFVLSSGNSVEAGTFQLQVGEPFPATPFTGNVFFGPFETLGQGGGHTSGTGALQSGTATFNLTIDQSHSGGDLQFDQGPVTFSLTLDASGNGHFSGQLSNGASGTETGYLISAFEFPTFDTTSNNPNIIVAQSIAAPPGTPSPNELAVNFPNPVTTGQSAQSAPITVTNTGLGPLGFTGVNTANSPDFNATGTCIPTGAVVVVVVQPGGTCTIIVNFMPVTAGAHSESFTVTTDGTSGVMIDAVGTAVSGATATAAPSSLAFGAVVVNTTSGAQAVTVSVPASSPSAVGIETITVPTGFTETDNCVDTTLQPGGSCTINLTFAPKTTGSFSGNLSVTDTAANSPQTVALTGTSVSGSFTAAPASLNFGTVVINTTSPPQTVTVTNGTTQNQFILSIVPPAGYAETDNCNAGGQPLVPGASCTINVTFTPTSATTFSGNLVITAGPQNSPAPTQFTVALTGNGTNSTFSLALAPGSSPTATVIPGGTAAFGIVVTGTPGVSQTINFNATTTSNTITVIVTPASVTITGTGNTQFAVVLNTFCRGTTTSSGQLVPGNPGTLGRGFPLVLLALGLAGMAWGYRRRPRWALSFALLMLMAIGGAACGGDPGSNGPTPPGTYPITLTATSGQQVQTLNLTLIVQ